jgi:hypothetical protein
MKSFTRLVSLWLENDEGLYSEVKSLIADAAPDDPDDEEQIDHAVERLEKSLRAMVEVLCDQENTSGLVGDLLNRSLNEVDWNELAEDYISELGSP